MFYACFLLLDCLCDCLFEYLYACLYGCCCGLNSVHVLIIGALNGGMQGTITSAEEVEEIFKAAGMKNPTKTMIKINQYFTTGTMEDVEKAKSNPQVTALQNLTKVYAIGPSKAIELHTKLGITTIDELRDALKKDYREYSWLFGRGSI